MKCTDYGFREYDVTKRAETNDEYPVHRLDKDKRGQAYEEAPEPELVESLSGHDLEKLVNCQQSDHKGRERTRSEVDQFLAGQRVFKHIHEFQQECSGDGRNREEE